MKKTFFITIFLLFSTSIFAQTVQKSIKYVKKVEVSYMHYLYEPKDAETSKSNSKNSFEDLNSNGFEVNFVNGISFLKNKMFAGIGVGYTYSSGYNGFSISTEIEYLPLNTRVSPLINLEIGYINEWYKSGGRTERMYIAPCLLGVNCRITDKSSIYLKTGFMFTPFFPLQVPLTIGFKF